MGYTMNLLTYSICDVYWMFMPIYCPCISENCVRNEMLWFLVDNFLAKSYRNHYHKCNPANVMHFIKKSFEYSAVCNSRFSSTNTNMLARIQNVLVSALNGSKHGIFPKYIVVVLDDDIISFLDCKTSDGVATLYRIWLKWLVDQIESVIKARCDQVPPKSKKITPFIYWVTAPVHAYFSKEGNNLRIKFNLSLDSVIKGREDMCVMRSKDYWNTKDSLLVINDRITEMGIIAYYNVIDASFKYNSERCEVFVAKQLAARHPDRPEQCDRDVAPDPMRRFFDRHRLDNVESHRVALEDLPRIQTEDQRFRRGSPGNRDFRPYNRFFLA